jgi:hypothetical protein
MEQENRLVSIDPALLALMHGSFGKDGMVLPFAREIMLVECQIAGTSHRDVKAIEPTLTPGTLLVLLREPQNAHDPLAIMILDENGHHIGYVPRLKNEALARLMDAGKVLFARLESKRWHGEWLCAEVRIFLRDT